MKEDRNEKPAVPAGTNVSPLIKSILTALAKAGSWLLAANNWYYESFVPKLLGKRIICPACMQRLNEDPDLQGVARMARTKGYFACDECGCIMGGPSRPPEGHSPQKLKPC